MCGIAGIYSFDTGKPVLKQEIDLLTDAVAHRGPDGRGVWIDPDNHIALGHRRLSILDLSENGKQPMSYGNGRYWMTYNGEIYNFLEIKEDLSRKGYVFISDSDSEIILAAYQEWGKEMLDRFNGMWAFAIYDSVQKSLLLSRDRFGVKPLYYFKDENRFLFSSEVQALHKVLGMSHPLNDSVIRDIVVGSFANHGTEETYLQGVHSLPGGCNLILKDDSITIEEWYSLRRVEVPDNFGKQAVELRKLLSDACSIRLRSDVPIGTCLSGGLDSGSITAVIASSGVKDEGRFSHYTHRSFCAAFPGTPLDESVAAKSLAGTLGSDLDIMEITPPSNDELEMAMDQCDGPMHALAFFPIWSLYRHIREQGIQVTLDGQGPDEMLGGYRPVYEALTAAIELRKPGWFLDLYRTYSEQGETSQYSAKDYARKITLVVLFKWIAKAAAYTLKYFGIRIYADYFSKLEGNDPSFLGFSKRMIPWDNSLDASLFRQFFVSPLPGILNQYDRCSMAHGVECRMPFMDYRIVEFIFSLPPESKVGHGYTKRVLREAMRDLVPEETRLNKLKIGFNAPIVDWFKGPLKEFMLARMQSQLFIDSEYFDGKELQRQFGEFLENPDAKWNDAWKFWPPVHFSWWQERNFFRPIKK